LHPEESLFIIFYFTYNIIAQLVKKLNIRAITKTTINMKNAIFATKKATPAVPRKPNIAAITAITKAIKATSRNEFIFLLLCIIFLKVEL